jgi:hypothetical protein
MIKICFTFLYKHFLQDTVRVQVRLHGIRTLVTFEVTFIVGK